MTKKKLLFIFNPRSGKGRIRNHLVEIVDTFVKAGYEVKIHSTQRHHDALEMVQNEGGSYDLVVCSGGDGTLDETVNGIMLGSHRIPIGYIPAGSTNDFAQSIRIPKNMRRAAEVAVNGVCKSFDVGKFNEKYFVYIAAFGLFTDVSYLTSQNLKNIFGHVAYLLESAKRLIDIPSFRMKVRYGTREIEDEFVYGMITNSISVAGVKNMTGKNVGLDDGVFEVNLIRMPQNPIELNEIFSTLINFKERSEYIYSFKTSHLEIECEKEVPWTVDGEFGGDCKTVVIDNKHQALKIMVKSNADS